MNHKAGDVVLTKFGKGQIIYINPDGRLAEVRYPSRTSCLTRYYHMEDLQALPVVLRQCSMPGEKGIVQKNFT